MEKWKIDVAVLCIFFARPEQFEKSFETVRKAKPRVLLLWQDGPREGRPDDIENIKKCQEIADKIDWECEVHKNYHDKNMGCDPSTHLSHKWAFSIVDKCIILEDDVVPSQSFFPFCKELLDKYENDTRVDRICGQTLYGGIEDKRYSYFFSRIGSSIGWASWRRVAETWESEYQFLNDDYFLSLAKKRYGHKSIKSSIVRANKRKAEGVPYWEPIVGYRTLLNSGLVIYPTVNMIENVGTSVNATHAPKNIKQLPKDIQQVFITKAEEISFPLNHPPYIIEDYNYFDKRIKYLHPSFFRKLGRKIERLFRIIFVR
ncbi:MAG: hypothetical protein E7372_03650 [Clostridiales bacterium]|nr:hypothetical protein [Clostridiales bacterium]